MFQISLSSDQRVGDREREKKKSERKTYVDDFKTDGVIVKITILMMIIL